MWRQWTVNGRFLTQPVTGVQRYGREILQALENLFDERHEKTRGLKLELILPDVEVTLPQLRHIKVRRVGRLSGHLWEQFELPVHAHGGILSFCNTSTIARKKQIVCVHDINTITHPHSYSFGFRTLYGALIPLLAANSSIVATVSEYSAKQIAAHGYADDRNIRVIPNGHEHALRWKQDDGAAPALVDLKTVIAIGSPAAHKNLALLLTLAPELAKHGLRLAVAGLLDPSVFLKGNQISDSRNIQWLGGVSDSDLLSMYRSCLCLAFPSRAEGFGLPPLEAMTLGCPVVSSDCASLPEVCGDAVVYASPDNPEAWLNAFVKLKSDTALRSSLVRKGRERAQRFNWKKSAEMYLDAMSEVDGIAPADSFQASAKRLELNQTVRGDAA
jgi:glycosyltransferase involved in cell wall biosynthesis